MKPFFIEIQNFWAWANVYLGLGFEFWPQTIKDLAFVCPQSVIELKKLFLFAQPGPYLLPNSQQE